MTSPVSTVLPGVDTASTLLPTKPVELGWGATIGDLGAFERSMQNAAARTVMRVEGHPLPEPSAAAQALMRPFDHVDGQAVNLAREADTAKAEGREMSPSELLSLTVRCHEFMFHCQLTSNIANRTSDGLQQLFRQQS
jgi:hypothetical protein